MVCPSGTVGGVDVRGAAPGTRETDLLRSGNLVEEVHAIVLSGGSAFGLDAASGVVEALAERKVGLDFGDSVIPIVPSAILFDLTIGRSTHPTANSGARAFKKATSGRIEMGSVGAGTGATVAKFAGRDKAIKGGVGTASELLDTGVIVAALAVVNAVGAIRDPNTGGLVAAPREGERGFLDIDRELRGAKLLDSNDDEELPENTTLAVVATNACLTKTETNRIATVAHDGFASTIWPVHTKSDGDVIFSLSTGEYEVDWVGYRAIEAFAVRAVERAVLKAVSEATSLADVPSASDWRNGIGN